MSQPTRQPTGRTAESYLGIDGGGTKTQAVIVDRAGRVLGRGAAGGANQDSIGLAAARDALLTAATAAAAAAGATLPLAAAWIGLAGVDAPADVQRFLPYALRLATTVRVTNDAELLLGALPRATGVALIAGTGSIAVGRSAAGASARAGGWGHIFGDEGSGYEIGRAALQAVAGAGDGRTAPTALTRTILRAWDLNEPSDLIACVYHERDKAAIARLAPLVLTCADAGDAQARRIVRTAAREQARAAATVARTLGLDGALAVALGGGLLVHVPRFRAQVVRALAAMVRLGTTVVVDDPAREAALAARRLGREEAGHGGTGDAG
ncbi:MAG: BadF/BadG/BcrA/BcrD ATPase family protein [Ktedonobacterales bacterium]